MADTPPRHSRDTSWLVLVLTLADTTWRLIVPTLAFALIGLKLDLSVHTAPWLTLGGTALGFVLAGLLIRNQLRKLS